MHSAQEYSRGSNIIRLEAITTGLEAMAIWLEAIAIRLEAITIGLEAIAIGLEAIACIGWRPSVRGNCTVSV